MTYRKMLELYNQGKLDEQQRIEIEKDLEKQEALTDYLFEHLTQPEADGLFEVDRAFTIRESDKAEKWILEQIDRSIRRSFIMTGTIAVIIAIAISVCVTLALL